MTCLSRHGGKAAVTLGTRMGLNQLVNLFDVSIQRSSSIGNVVALCARILHTFVMLVLLVPLQHVRLKCGEFTHVTLDVIGLVMDLTLVIVQTSRARHDSPADITLHSFEQLSVHCRNYVLVRRCQLDLLVNDNVKEVVRGVGTGSGIKVVHLEHVQLHDHLGREVDVLADLTREFKSVAVVVADHVLVKLSDGRTLSLTFLANVDVFCLFQTDFVFLRQMQSQFRCSLKKRRTLVGPTLCLLELNLL